MGHGALTLRFRRKCRKHLRNTPAYTPPPVLSFFTKDGAEYLISGDLVYIRDDAVPELTADTAYCTLGTDGYARYYNVGKVVLIGTTTKPLFRETLMQ